MYLGIEQQTGFIYEGTGNPDIPCIPLPTVAHAKIIDSPDDWKSLPVPNEAFGLVFREDSFDAVSRIRRGRLYEKREGTQPSQQLVSGHPYDRGMPPGYERAAYKSLFVYMACFSILQKPNQGRGLTLALGSARGASAWRVVQTEALYSGAVMITLKALTAYGIVPELDLAKIDDRFKAAVSQAVAKAVDAAFKQDPGSVVDCCKDAMQVVISSWLVKEGAPEAARGLDIADTAAMLEAKPYAKLIAGHLGKVAGLLHPRNKTNVLVGKGYRRLLEEDAEFALQSLGLALRELGWAKMG